MIPAAHQQFVHHAVAVLRRTPGIVGVAIGGSWQEQALDEFSDLDLVLIMDPAAAPRLLAERPAVAASLGRLLECFTGEHVGEPRLLICLYDEPLLHVDLKFVALPDLARRVEDPEVLWEQDGLVSAVLRATPACFPEPELQWIEDRFWIWVHYAATKLGRGELLEVVSFLDFLRSTVLGPLLARRQGRPARGVRKLEQLLPPAELAALHATVAPAESVACAAALRQAIATYRSLRAAAPVAGFVAKTLVETRATAYLEAVIAAARPDSPLPAGTDNPARQA